MVLRYAWAVTVLMWVGTVRAGDLHEIFYAPFDGSTESVIARGQAKPYQERVTGYIDGVKGKAVSSIGHYNGLRWDGRGNIDMERGTLSLFYCPMGDVGAAQRDSLFGVSTDIEGYWAGVIDFLNKKDQGLDAKPAFDLHFYDIRRYAKPLRFQPIFGRWQKGQWHHIAMVWDRNQGITIYEDGKRADSNWGEYRWDWNFPPRMLVLGAWQYSTTPFAADEMRIYADCLTDAQIAQLARNEAPTGTPLPRLAESQSREADLARMGWSAADVASIPVAPEDKTVRLTFARITHSVDAKRLVAQPFEGFTGSCWPIQKYGPSTAGAELEVHFAPDQSFDRVRVFSHGPFAGTLREASGDGKKLMPVGSARPVWQGKFGDMRTDASLVLERTAGTSGVVDFQRSLGAEPHSIGQIDFYRAETVKSLPKNLREYRGFAKLDRMPDTQAGRAALGDTPVHFDNPVLATMEKTKAWKSVTPAFGGFQMITETMVDPTAMDGVVVKLVVEDLREPTPVHIVVKEPILPQRDWLAGDVVLVPKSKGKQVFTIHLAGRPIISYPKDDLKVARDRVISDPGREVAVLVTAANPTTWVMGDGGCCLSLCLADVEAIKATAIADQIEFSREAYAEHNEGHIWDVIGEPGWGRLHYPLKWLMRFAPDHRVTQQLALRVGYRTDPVPFVEPVNDTGAPEWAFWQRQAFNECKRILKWIIQNRGVETGEFGGVWGDDTDMTEYWTQDALAGDDDQVIGDAMRKFWPNLYKHCLKDGVSEAVRDTLHSYEEGMGCISHQLLLDYGDPSAIERVMRSCAHYNKWMAQNPDGTWRFLGNYLGWDGVWTEGDFGKDHRGNSMMLIPAGYLVWYNRHPTAAKYVTGWSMILDSPSIAADAALELKGDKEFARKWYETESEKAITTGRYFHAINCLLDVTPVKEEQKARLLNISNGIFNFTKGNALPEYAGYSPVMTEAFWMAYKATGDIEYLTRSYKQACRFINNQDWLYTVAQPSTDRIPVPDTSAVRARLGAFVTERGGHNNVWPRHGISYVSGSDDIAALVTQNDESNLVVRLYCFAGQEHALQVRLWKLLPGTYALKMSNDKNDDGTPEEALYERTIEVDRGVFVDLKLPSRQCSILEVRAVKNHEPDYNLPDPAVGVGDVFRGADGRFFVQVHNVGVQPVKDLVVRVTNEKGVVVSEQTIAAIAPPLDFEAKIVLVAVPNLLDVTTGKLTVTLDPEGKHADLNRYNNRVVYDPGAK